ncbi:MAG: tRNA glutamyl-Q(34) synthetase GluQRS [Pseudomonadota bacterium]
MLEFVTRFAPSPTGYLHLGHAYSAVLCQNEARRNNGSILLRIEDIDQTRCKPEYTAAIIEDLEWLGIVWSEPIVTQSERMDAYKDALHLLHDKHLLYRCFKSRQQIAEALEAQPRSDADDRYSQAYFGKALPPSEEKKRIEAGDPFAWRLSVRRALEHIRTDKPNNTEDNPGANDGSGLCFLVEDDSGAKAEGRTANPLAFGDVVIARKDFPTSYHLASVVDDAAANVSHVIRGEDLADAPHIQVLLQHLLGYSTPIYRHHRLITGKDGKRLAKRNRSETLRSQRERGLSPQEVLKRLGVSISSPTA